MSRRSIRLQISRYYNDNGEPTISYRENTYRVFIRRKYHRHSQPDLTEGNRNGKSRFVLGVISLSFVLAYLTLMLSSNFLDVGLSESPVSPLLKTTDCTGRCEEMERQLRELHDKLLKYQRQMNDLRPIADTLPNFALRSSGANTVSHLSSQSYHIPKSPASFLGIPLRYVPLPRHVVIEGTSTLLPGRCWAFAGGRGHLFITLSHPVTISHVTLGHIAKNQSPSGTITSAPKEFSVYAMEKLDDKGTKLGTFLYDYDGDRLQTFKIPDDKQGVFQYVKLQVESNWGHPDYSCLYSFRVHGKQP